MNTFKEVAIFREVLETRFPELKLRHDEIHWEPDDFGDDWFRMRIFFKGNLLGIYYRSAYDEAYFLS